MSHYLSILQYFCINDCMLEMSQYRTCVKIADNYCASKLRLLKAFLYWQNSPVTTLPNYHIGSATKPNFSHPACTLWYNISWFVFRALPLSSPALSRKTWNVLMRGGLARGINPKMDLLLQPATATFARNIGEETQEWPQLILLSMISHSERRH